MLDVQSPAGGRQEAFRTLHQFTDGELAAHDAEVRAQALREAVASLRSKFGPTNRAADYLARAEQTKEDR